MKKLRFNHFVLIGLVIFFVFVYIRHTRVQNDIKNHGENIVVKFIRKEDFPKTTDFYFSYYLGDSLVTTTGSGLNYSVLNSEEENKIIDNLKIGSYYLARFYSKYPNIINVDPSKRITDTLLIQKFGFNIDN